jgi:hypothetical protein
MATDVAHSHFGPRIWLAGRRFMSISAASFRMPSAIAASMSSLRLRSLRSLHRRLALISVLPMLSLQATSVRRGPATTPESSRIPSPDEYPAVVPSPVVVAGWNRNSPWNLLKDGHPDADSWTSGMGAWMRSPIVCGSLGGVP